jgi:hypothetical protein
MTTVPDPRGVRVAASFRDPSGFVFERDGLLLRQVNQVYRPHYDRLMASGLYDSLVSDGLLVSHEEVGEAPLDPSRAYKVLAPERVAFISYSYEWCFGQLKDAALLTLEVHRRALAHGRALKDASAYNVQFRDGRPVFVDTLSFEPVRERPWVAYRQFTEHFLAPLALLSRVHIGLWKLLRAYPEGVPLDVAARLLPWRSILSPSLLLHVHLHARAIRGVSATARPVEAREGSFPLRSHSALVESLESAVKSQRWEPRGTVWADYYADSGYAAAAFEHKRRFVARFLDEAQPRTVWDVGANTGEFSRLAAERGISTVAIDVDPGCVERLYRDVVKPGGAGSKVLPLLIDALDPSPARGWMGRERMSLFERGPAGACLALATVHHLAVGGNVPLDQIAAFFRRLAPRLVVEFVPKSDPQFRRLMAAREDVFDDYSQEAFETAFIRLFAVDRAERLTDSERTIYEMSARSSG